MPFFTAGDGARLFYRCEGPDGAPAVILSNSLGTDHMMWQEQAVALSPRMRVIRYDQRGHGASDAPADPAAYGLERLGRDVVELADHLELSRFSFAGCSMGGVTGQWLGLNAASRLEKLILANTAAYLGPPSNWEERIAIVEQKGTAGVAEATLGRFFSPGFHAARPERVAEFRRVILETPKQGYLGCVHMLRSLDLREAIAGMAVPVLVVSGSGDPSTPPERGQFIAGKIPGARHVMLEAFHISNVEQAAAFNRAVLQFLTGSDLPSDDRFAAGMARRRAVLGDAWVDRSVRNRTEFNADFQDLLQRYCWGEVWTRSGLPEETRRIIVLMVTASLSRWEEFDLHLRAALAAGMKRETLKEALLQLGIYAGIPAANTAFQRAGTILAEIETSRAPD